MEEEQCFACVICDFMTYRSVNLETHFRLKHNGMLPKSVLKRTSEPLCTVIRQMDEILYNSSLFAARMPLAITAEKSTFISRLCNEIMDELQLGSEPVPDLRNDLSDEEPYPVTSSTALPDDESHTTIAHVKPVPDQLRHEISNPEFLSSGSDHINSRHEDREVDTADKPLLSANTLCVAEPSIDIIDEGEEKMVGQEEGNGDWETGANHGQICLPVSNMAEISKSVWICWKCFGKFARCIGPERSLFLKHSKSFCPYANYNFKDAPIDRSQVRLFCPKDCNFVTSDANAFCKHVPSCLKSESHARRDDFMQIQSNVRPLIWTEVRLVGGIFPLFHCVLLLYSLEILRII